MGHELKRMMQRSPNRNVSTLYGVSTLVRFSLEVLMKITPMRFKVFPSREEALAFTDKMIESEQQLPDTRPYGPTCARTSRRVMNADVL